MVCEIIGWDYLFAFSPYSEAWRERRRLFVKYFRSPGHSDEGLGTGVHTSQVYEFVHRFVLDVSEKPEDVYDIVRRCVQTVLYLRAHP